ncbi:hypothetical protein IV203_007909 [Nitzschia inconspicua]|uniref:TLC domain-containing protein n=1 Tax=Nitzschia inconspicua TaxID=303405 RepID=A0A9K3KY66_9STRA|nr:hypothetical protein IV203_007909 [Nitzschia inconspicua]
MVPPAIVFFESLLPYGLTCLGCHAVLWVIFRYLLPSSGPWHAAPNFTAHQTIALFLMIQWTLNGFFGEDDEEDMNASTNSLPVILRPSSLGMKMARRSMAALWIWDIPVSMLTSDMSSAMDALMHAHHLGMLLVTCIVMGWLTFGTASETYPNPVGATLAPLFFGQVELSSIPLQIVDLFHPKKSAAWHEYMLSRPMLVSINDACRQLFALLFLAVRGIYFPFLVFTIVIPEFWDALGWSMMEDQTKYVLPIVTILTFSVAFTLLQMYWAVLVVNQIYKAMKGGGDKKKSG